MSTKTLRKRIAITATSALVAGVLSAVVSAPVASANHPAAGSANAFSTIGAQAGRDAIGSLFVGTVSNLTGAASVTTTATGASDISGNAKSLGLLAKDTSSGTAQTATVLAGGRLSLYAQVSTAAAFTATAGTFASTIGGPEGAAAATYSGNLRITFPAALTAATGIATLWTAPSTAGTYSVSLLTGWITSGTTEVVPSLTNGLPDDLSGSITVTVVAASAGGAVSAANSACNTAPAAASITAGSGTAGIDNTAIYTDGTSAYINFDLNDAYSANLVPGNVVATATNGGLVNIGSGSGATAGTASTDVDFIDGSADTVRVSQPTAGAPLTTTVTVTYNGTTVCTKTITIRGAVAKLTVANIGSQKTNNSTVSETAQWMYQQTGAWITGGALFTVVATDSAGNVVSTPTTLGAYSADSATLTTTVQALAVNTTSTTATASNVGRFNYGSWGCGVDAGQASVRIQFTTAATGVVVSSDPFVARCAGDRYSYAASLDKASYTIGDLATATVRFLDSKGNAANSVTAPGANTFVLPFMTGVDFTLPSASATAVTKADGTVSYTFTVGTATGATAGTYTGIIEYSSAAIVSPKSTPTYKISTGGDTTTNADVLKSIVALIASINKQIQALQKLILKR